MSTRQAHPAISHTTYQNYIAAYAGLTRSRTALNNSQDRLPCFSRLQREQSPCTSAIQAPLHRGWLTLHAMRLLPIRDQPEFAASARLWAPILAYYAARDVAIAALVALGNEAPRGHSKLREMAVGQHLTDMLPAPFGIVCKGDPRENSCATAFPPTSISARAVSEWSNLGRLRNNELELAVCKALKTTRQGELREKFESERADRKRGRRRLSLPEKRRIAGGKHPTSVFDFLYRMRIRANYRDPGMFLRGRSDDTSPAEDYSRLLQVTDTLVGLLGRVIQRKIGAQPFREIEQAFSAR